jgi:hypothetical protein
VSGWKGVCRENVAAPWQTPKSVNHYITLPKQLTNTMTYKVYMIIILGSIIDIHFYETLSNPSVNLSTCAYLLLDIAYHCIKSASAFLLIRHTVSPKPKPLGLVS